MRPKALLPLILFTFAILAGPVVAQEEPEVEFGELIEVSEVLLDVLVTDRQGNVVVGLDADDFVVAEAGNPVPVSSVSFYSNRFLLRDEDSRTVQHPAANEIPADRYFVLFIHDQKRLGSNQTRLVRQQLDASRQSQRWVREEMLPGDWVAVVSYDVKLKVHQDFTHDQEALVRAIEDAARGKDPGNQWASRRAAIPEGQPSLLRDLPDGKELRHATTRIYDALRLVAEATHDIVGRKSLMLFTIGFGDLRRAGAVNVATGAGAITEPDRRYYPALKQALNDNNVAVYPIDLVPNEFDHLQSHFLTQLANDTGGFYHYNFVNFFTPMQRIADENNGYYLLSYQSEHPSGESGYREVTVETRNPEFQVRARKGYRYGAS